MTLLYLSLGFFLGGISALVIMAMFFVSKRAGDNEDQMSTDLNPAVSHQEIT
jgi:hypothetical protein